MSLRQDTELTEEETQSENVREFLTFAIEGETFGVDILQIHEILKPAVVTRVPNVGDHILGVVNLRGEIIPILDIKRLFGMGFTKLTASSRIVVTMHESKRAGILVDQVKQVVKVPVSKVSEAVDEIYSDFSALIESVSQVEGQLILNLSLGRIVDFSESEF